MTTLLGLPKYPFLYFLVNWIPLEDLAKLDTSISSKSCRALFLNHLQCAVFRGFRRNHSENSWNYGDVMSCYMKDEAANSVVKWLTIRNVSVAHMFLTDTSFKNALKAKLYTLTSLCFSISTGYHQMLRTIPDDSISSLTIKAPKITSISMSHGGSLVSEASVLHLLKCYNKQVKSLMLGFDSKMSTKLIVLSITEHLSNLTALHISASSSFEDSDLELICASCVTLVRLDISHNPRLTPKRSGVAIVNYLVNLSHISFDQKTTSAASGWFRLLRRRFAKLKTFDLRRCIAEGISLPTRQTLTKVEVAKEMNFSRHLGFGSDDVFNLNDTTHFFPTCKEVEHVVMPRYVVGMVLDTFAYYCCSECLVELNLQGSPSTTDLPLDPSNDLQDGSLFILAHKCSKLKIVNFSYRECITDMGMMALLAKNPELETLYCVYCSNLGSDTMVALSQYCPRLRTLNMSGCGDLTNLHLSQLASGCSYLTHLAINHLDSISTAAITTKSVRFLVECCKLLENVQLSPPGESYSLKRGYHLRSFGHEDYVPELVPM